MPPFDEASSVIEATLTKWAEAGHGEISLKLRGERPINQKKLSHRRPIGDNAYVA